LSVISYVIGLFLATRKPMRKPSSSHRDRILVFAVLPKQPGRRALTDHTFAPGRLDRRALWRSKATAARKLSATLLQSRLVANLQNGEIYKTNYGKPSNINH
jgi:hypothetical protein